MSDRMKPPLSAEAVKQALVSLTRLRPASSPADAQKIAGIIDDLVFPAILERYGKHGVTHADILWEHFQGEPYGSKAGYSRLPSALNVHVQYWESCVVARVYRMFENGTLPSLEFPHLESDVFFAKLLRSLAEKLQGLPPIRYNLSYQPKERK